MALLAGLLLGLGLVLVWWSFWTIPEARSETGVKKDTKLRQLIAQSGIERLHPAGVIAVSAVLGFSVFTIISLLTRALPVGLSFGFFAGLLPILILRWQANKRRVLLRDVWPDAIDHLRSAIRAGLSLPEAISQLSVTGPEQLRPALSEFADDYRSGMRFGDALEQLKFRMADPIADRLVVALKITREVGGADVGQLLGTLSEFLREDARTRAELETRQSWTVNGAKLAVSAPWIVLLLLATQPQAMHAYQSVQGLLLLAVGVGVSVLCYRLMLRIGALPTERRVL
ncbi:MAG: type II secretion system F family protein [Micrococcaceae bacterium]